MNCSSVSATFTQTPDMVVTISKSPSPTPQEERQQIEETQPVSTVEQTENTLKAVINELSKPTRNTKKISRLLTNLISTTQTELTALNHSTTEPEIKRAQTLQTTLSLCTQYQAVLSPSNSKDCCIIS